MKAIQFTHAMVDGVLTETAVMDDGTVWIRTMYAPSAALPRWNPWKRVQVPTDADRITAEEE